MTDRRAFLHSLGLGALAICVPQYGRWHRQGSGLLVRAPALVECYTPELLVGEFNWYWRKLLVPMPGLRPGATWRWASPRCDPRLSANPVAGRADDSTAPD
jgi:hypothetical protein